MAFPRLQWQALTYTEEEIPALAETPAYALRGEGPHRRLFAGRVSAQEPWRSWRTPCRQVLRPTVHEVLVEQRIYGRELTDAVLGDRYLPPVETFPSVENFDYEAKYQAGGAREICPAELTEAQAKAVGEMALRVHKALGLAVYSRTDMILDEDGKLWCLEANSLPGMTPTSFVPKEAAAVGIELR